MAAELRQRGVPAAATAPPTSPHAHGGDDEGGSYDCNVCYDTAREPVVTLCGHLYCWPCLYR